MTNEGGGWPALNAGGGGQDGGIKPMFHTKIMYVLNVMLWDRHDLFGNRCVLFVGFADGTSRHDVALGLRM